MPISSNEKAPQTKEEQYRYFPIKINIKRSKELHMETLNMMTKYQIIYMRFETAVLLLSNIRKTHDKTKLLSYFMKFRKITQHSGLAFYKDKFIAKLKESIKTLYKIYKRKNTILKTRSLNTWKNNIQRINYMQHNQKIIKEIELKSQAELSKKDKNAENLKEKILKKTQEINMLKENEISLKNTIKDYENKEKSLSENIEKHKQNTSEDTKKPNSGISKRIEEKIRILEQKSKTLETENQKLKEKANVGEGDVLDFVSEMNDYLDSIESTSKF